MATDLETADGPRHGGRRPRGAAGLRSGSPAGRGARAASSSAAFVLYTLLSLGADGPRVHPDEVRYLIAASSLVEGEGLTLRGQDYGFGPLLPLVLAAILRVAGSVDAAYDWFKAANALFFALTAVPVYLLARRLVSQWWAVVAAALAVAIPSSISVVTVMTESLSYLTTMWALYAIALALERPSVLRQLAVLGTVAAAVLTRTQFGILYVTWVGALACLWLLAPATRPRSRAELVRFWPTALPVVLGALAFVARLASGSSAKDTFGAYWELWRGYDPFAVAKWFVYHLGDFAVYLVVVPVAVAPIVLWELGRAGRAGSRRAAAFVSLFAAANVVGAARRRGLHEHAVGLRPAPRPLRVLPRAAVARRPRVWLASGLPRPARRGRDRRGRHAGAGADPALRAAGERGRDRHRPGRALGADRGGAGRPGARIRPPRARDLRRRACSRRRSSCRGASPASPCRSRSRSGSRRCRTSRGSACSMRRRTWSSRAASSAPGSTTVSRTDAAVTKLYVDTTCGSALERHALFLTEFFNSTVDRAAYVGGSTPDGLPIDRVDVARIGRARARARRPAAAPTTSSRSRASSSPGERVADGNGRRPRALARRRPGPRRRRVVERRSCARRLPAPSARGAGSRSG